MSLPSISISCTSSCGDRSVVADIEGNVHVFSLQLDRYVYQSSFIAYSDSSISSIALSPPEYGSLVAIIPSTSHEVLLYKIDGTFVVSLEIPGPGLCLHFAPDSFKLFISTDHTLLVFGIDVQWSLLDEIEFRTPVSAISPLHNNFALVSCGPQLHLLGESSSGTLSQLHIIDLPNNISSMSGSPLVRSDDQGEKGNVCVGLENGSVYFCLVNFTTNYMEIVNNPASHGDKVVDIKWNLLGNEVLTSSLDRSVITFSCSIDFTYQLLAKIDIANGK
ncbi:hypothetical protein P9112_006536 [Eukaryota sp. TZLM1-RC]